MGLESGITIQSLDASNPPGGDPRSQGAGHLRLIKNVLKNIFPGASGDGFNIPITASEVEINYLEGVTSPIQDQINSQVLIPIGGIIMWAGGVVPTNWHICDGTSGTPDLRNKFVVAAGTTYPAGDTGGFADSIVVSHTHNITDHTHTVTDPGHIHPFDYFSMAATGAGDYGNGGQGSVVNDATASATTGITISSATGVTADSTGVSGVGRNIPPYYSLAYIMRIS